MFFNSFDRNASQMVNPVNPRSWRRIRKGSAAIALAVAAAAPVVTLTAPVRAMSEIEQALVLLAETAKPSDPELLAIGLDQYAKGQFEEAQATLQQVRPDGLPEADRRKLTDAMRKTEAALAQRKDARAQFELGEAALAEKNYDQAIRHYRAAADSKYADDQTRSKAQSQMAVAKAAAQGPDLRGKYREAVADYKAGNYDAAKAKFTELSDAGYRGGLFDRKPADYLKDIEKKQAQAAPPAVAAAQPAAEATQAAAAQPAAQAAPAEVAAAPAEQPARNIGKEEYEAGRAAYRGGDYAAARKHFEAARDAGYKPGLFQDSPSKYLSMIAAKEAKAAPAEAAAAAARPAETVSAPVQPAEPIQPAAAQPVAVNPAAQDLQTAARVEELRRQQRAYEAQQLVQKAVEAQRENRLADAYYLYSQAVELDPANKAAVDGKAQTQLVTTGGNDRPLIESQIRQIELRKQIIRYSFDRAIADARQGISEKRFEQANEAVLSAQVAANSAPELFSREELNAFTTTIADTRMALVRAQELASAEQGRAVADQVARDAQRREQIENEERRRTVASLGRTARQLIYDGNYPAALGVINQILAIDPTNDYAIGVRQLVQDQAVIAEQRMHRERLRVEVQKQLNSAQEKLIPYMDLMNYPSNWPDISDMRDREVQQERGGGAQEAQMQALLDRKLTEIKFDQVPLSDVIEFLRDVTGANIFVNWRTIEQAGVERSAPVTARLRDVKFSKALNTILSDVGGGAIKLGYTTDEGVITISTAEDLNKNTVINVYDIRDLLIIAPDFTEPPDFMLGGGGYGGGGYGGGGGGGGGRRGGGGGGRFGGGGSSYGGGGGGIFGGGGSYGGGSSYGSGGSNQNTQQRTQELVDEITTLIKETVDRESWIDNGGQFGSLKFLSGQLIVTQTPENQRQLVSLLDKLRETRAIQVSIETRFLTVQRNFMEDIGVDIDFFFNIADPNRWSPIEVSQGSNVWTQAPTTPTPGSIGSTAQPSMTIRGSFLDEFQVNFLIRATQASENSTVLTAPRVTVFNGQSAYVVVAQQTAYVSDLEAVTGEGVGLFNPIIDTVASGVRLVVQPTVSADRKYVTLSLQPQVSQLVQLVPFPVYGVEEDTGNDNGGGNQQPQVFSANVQLPIINVTAVNTIVSVPDGGTLLLGGQTLAGEREIEQGVPILSKIPFLKRLFTNKSSAKDEQILLILVKPTIIIHREVEQQQFPLLNTRARS